jgi:hypothetical protein
MPEPIRVIANEPTITSRMAGRRKRPLDEGAFATFFHIAAIDCWKAVVFEMKQAFDKAGVKPKCCVLGAPDDLEWVRCQGLEVIHYSENVREYEAPTQRLLWEWCHANPQGAVLYCHTKGASMRLSDVHAAWRRLMIKAVVEPCMDLLTRLRIADMVGVCWEDNPDYPHFCGNFWLARADWINELGDPLEYQNAGGPSFFSHPWERMSSEMWLGSKPWHYVESLACRNASLWTDWLLFELDFPGSDCSRLRELRELIEGYGSDSLQLYGGSFEGGRRIQQNPREFARLLNFLSKSQNRTFDNYLEIGAGAGGSLKGIHDAVGFVRASVIDNGSCSGFDLLEENTSDIAGLDLFRGDSQSERAKSFLGGKTFDLIGIDGDHSYEGVCNDWKLARPHMKSGALVWFHDTNWSQGVQTLLDELSGEFELVFATDQPVVGDHTLGIRVLRAR